MFSTARTREELKTQLDHISDSGQLVGIKNAKHKVVLLYTINCIFAELHYEKKHGLILDIKFYDQEDKPDKFFDLPA